MPSLTTTNRPSAAASLASRSAISAVWALQKATPSAAPSEASASSTIAANSSWRRRLTRTGPNATASRSILVGTLGAAVCGMAQRAHVAVVAKQHCSLRQFPFRNSRCRDLRQGKAVAGIAAIYLPDFLDASWELAGSAERSRATPNGRAINANVSESTRLRANAIELSRLPRALGFPSADEEMSESVRVGRARRLHRFPKGRAKRRAAAASGSEIGRASIFPVEPAQMTQTANARGRMPN